MRFTILGFILDAKNCCYVEFVLRASSVSLMGLALYLLLRTLVRVHFGACAMLRFLLVSPVIFIARVFVRYIIVRVLFPLGRFYLTLYLHVTLGCKIVTCNTVLNPPIHPAPLICDLQHFSDMCSSSHLLICDLPIGVSPTCGIF